MSEVKEPDEVLAEEVVEANIQAKKQKDKKDKGAGLVEYALLVALISVIAIVAIRVLGQTVSKQFSAVAGQLT